MQRMTSWKRRKGLIGGPITDYSSLVGHCLLIAGDTATPRTLTSNGLASEMREGSPTIRRLRWSGAAPMAWRVALPSRRMRSANCHVRASRRAIRQATESSATRFAASPSALQGRKIVAGGGAYIAVYARALIGLVEPGGAYTKNGVCATHGRNAQALSKSRVPRGVGRSPAPSMQILDRKDAASLWGLTPSLQSRRLVLSRDGRRIRPDVFLSGCMRPSESVGRRHPDEGPRDVRAT
jgi:hypothetical protein